MSIGEFFIALELALIGVGLFSGLLRGPRGEQGPIGFQGPKGDKGEPGW